MGRNGRKTAICQYQILANSLQVTTQLTCNDVLKLNLVIKSSPNLQLKNTVCNQCFRFEVITSREVFITLKNPRFFHFHPFVCTYYMSSCFFEHSMLAKNVSKCKKTYLIFEMDFCRGSSVYMTQIERGKKKRTHVFSYSCIYGLVYLRSIEIFQFFVFIISFVILIE